MKLGGVVQRLGDLLIAIFRPRVILGAILVGFCLMCLGWSLLWLTRSAPAAGSPSTAIFNVVDLPAATATALPGQPTPSATIFPTPPPGQVAIGAYVQVVGTGGTGLRLRAEPGLEGEVRLLASEAEVFQVTEGPVESSGYIWWYLVGPFDPSRYGWAVSNYLELVQNP